MRVFDEVFLNSTFGFPAIFFAASKQWADGNKDLLNRFNAALTEAPQAWKAAVNYYGIYDFASTLRDTGLPVIIVTNTGHRTGERSVPAPHDRRVDGDPGGLRRCR